MELKPARRLVEQSEADLLGQVRRVERAHSSFMPNSRSAAMKAAAAWPNAAPSSSVSAKGAVMPSRLTKRLATLVAMISRRRRCWSKASRWRSVICGGKAASSSAPGSDRRPARDLDRRLHPHLRGRQQHRQLRPGQAVTCWARRSSSLALQPLDGAVEPPALLEDLDHPDELRQPRPRARRSTAPASAAGCPRGPGPRPRRSSRRAAGCAPRTRPALGHLAIERDLDVDLVVRAVDAGRIVDEVGVDPPAARRTRSARPG